MLLPGISIMMTSFQSDVVSGLSVSASPTSVKTTKGFTDGASHTLTTPATTATAIGGSGSYTYAWTRLSGDAGISAVSPTAAATTFTGTLLPENDLLATFRVTATDTVTLGTAHFDVSVALHYVDFR